jgi:hypothetical protein
MLAKALAHRFESKLLLLDVSDFSLKVTFTAFIFLNFKFDTVILISFMFTFPQMQSKYGCAKKESVRHLCFILRNEH